MPEHPSRPDGDLHHSAAGQGRGGESPVTTDNDHAPSSPNAAAVPPSPETIHDLFSQQAALRPAVVALSAGAKVLTYGDLERRANQLANHLLALGLRVEDRVAVLTGRSPEFVVAALAALKAGCAYLPIDPRQPAARVSFMIKDAEARVVLTERRWEHLLEGLSGCELVRLDGGAKTRLIDTYSDEAPGGRAVMENAAYVIYTSGSTGRSKGVVVTHAALLNLVWWHRREYAVTSEDKATQVAGVGFDAAVWEIWATLACGASLHFPDDEVVLSAPALVRWLTGEHITICFLPTPLTEQALLEEWPRDTRLRWLLTGGDKLHRRPRPGLPFKLVNHYGPTEATVVTTGGVVEDESLADTVPSIGRPISDVCVYVLDERLRPTAPGVAGQLYVAGSGLARGYLARPALTAAAFVPDPFSGEAGARLYRTGDLGRWLTDGRLEFLGRADEQVKIRGFRVELGEIEHALARHPKVRATVVTMQGEASAAKRLTAYVVPESVELGASELRRFLSESLPEYMIPARFVWLDALPLTPNGKVDRRALPVPADSADDETPFVAPRGPVEEALAAAWSEVLELAEIGVDHNFFDLGGHSLLATQIASRLRHDFGVELGVADIFGHPTVAALAELLEQRRAGQAAQTLQPFERDARPPLSFSQERVWFIQQLHPENISYNFQATFRFKGDFDVAALERSLSEIVRRHEVFRTTFPASGGVPVQSIHEPYRVSLPLYDLRHLPEAAREAEAERLIGEEFRKPFDLSRLPLVRWTLVRLDDHVHVMTQVEHHLVHDGWSFNIFLRELVELYRSYASGDEPDLPELPIQFADFAAWQRRWLQGEVAESQLDYWTKKLAGSPQLLELPTDYPRPAVKSFRGRTQRFELPAPLCRSLRELSRREGVTLFMTMFSALLVLLHRYTRQEDICVGSAIANRRWRETEGLIGMIINNIVLRTDLSGDPTFAEILRRVRTVTLEAYEHQDVPFERVVEALQPGRGLSHNPLFQVMFGFHDSPAPALEFPGLTVELLEGLSNNSSKFDMSIIAIPRSEQRVTLKRGGGDDEITMLWEYSTDLFEEATVTRMRGHYERVLESVATDPGQRLSDITLLSEDERRLVLLDFNDTAADLPVTETVHQLFSERAAADPGHTALRGGGTSLSYGELERRSNYFARRLLALGLRVEDRVAVLTGRSPEFVVAALATLKAGGAYLPVDVQYPAERVRWMLSDAGTRVVLTERCWEYLLAGAPAGPHVLFLEEEPVNFDHREAAPVAARAGAGNAAYVIYTSGSTGTPKGVVVTHAALLNLVWWHRREYAVTSEDKATQVAGAGFDATVWEIWPYLTAGASVSIADEETRGYPPALVRWLADERITICFLPTPLLEAALQEPWPEESALRAILTGGDVLHRPQAMSLPFKLFNHYGPTEGTVVTTSSVVDVTEARALPPIGEPISNVRVYVLDERLRLVPPGVAGHLYVAGSGLARGYLARPALTAAAFVPDPFSGEAGARLYRSGDLGRWLTDGRLEFLGRADEQVKIRGFRVELGEIEAVLRAHPHLREAAVMALEDGGERRLVAYVVGGANGALSTDDLRGFLRAKLPEYMMPARFVWLDALPLTPNGKVDRRALPAPPQEFDGRAEDAAAPLSPFEEVVAGIWSEVLGVERVRPSDNFFQLGGHSLMAARVLSRVSETLRVELPLRSLFDAPGVAEFAVLVEEALLAAVENLNDEEARHRLGQ